MSRCTILCASLISSNRMAYLLCKAAFQSSVIKMRIVVTSDVSGTSTFPLEVNGDIEVENFLALCRFEIPALATVPVGNMTLTHNGRVMRMSSENLAKTVSDLGVHDNDIVLVSANKPTSSESGNSQASMIADLVKSIKVPAPSTSTNRLTDEETTQLRVLFDEMKNSPEHRNRLREVIPEIVAAAETGDFEKFCSQYVTEREATISRERVMLDPTNAEGQRMIAERIQRENIDYSHRFALEHMPEAYIPVTMLYIKMKINGNEMKAFVDSGAQVSILSDRAAQRCNLMRLVDKRFQATVHGVGGAQLLLGKIHACQVQIEKQFFACNFDVLADRDIDVLLGLDILKRHRCVIDLKNNCLRFGDSAMAYFLPDSEVPQRNLGGRANPSTGSSNNEVDSAKLASLMALGFEEAAARAMLIQCGNDVEMAAANLLARQSAS